MLCYSEGMLLDKATEGSAGFDLRATVDVTVPFNRTVICPTGIYVRLQPNTFGLIRERSSFGVQGLFCLGGIVDSDYRGEVKVILHNLSPNSYYIKANEKIANFILVNCNSNLPVHLTKGEWEDMCQKEKDHNQRGTGGFGSTGK